MRIQGRDDLHQALDIGRGVRDLQGLAPSPRQPSIASCLPLQSCSARIGRPSSRLRIFGRFQRRSFAETASSAGDQCGRILVAGIGAFSAPAEYRIMTALAKLFREDREAELAPENFRTLSAAELAETASSAGDQCGRKMISRLRAKISEDYQELYRIPLAPDAVIENVRGRGTGSIHPFASYQPASCGGANVTIRSRVTSHKPIRQANRHDLCST